MKIDALCEPNSISRSLKNFLIGIHIAMCSSFEVRCYYLSICADQDTFAQKAFTLPVHNGAKDFLNPHKNGLSMYVSTSDRSKLSWLEPELELKDFQLGLAWLVTFFHSARNQKLAETS